MPQNIIMLFEDNLIPFFLKLLNMSITAIWLVLAIVLLRLILSRAPRRIFFLLWAALALRLVCPFSLTSALSLIPSAETLPKGIEYAQKPEIHSGIAVLNSTVNPVIAETMAPRPVSSVNPVQVLAAAGAYLWLAGAVLMLLWSLISRIRLHRRVSAFLDGGEGIRICDDIPSPFIMGLFHPVIYLPSDLPESAVPAVLAHERAHISRLDHWKKSAAFLLLTLHWFNPLIWLAFVLFCRDVELACDEAVIRNYSRTERTGYSQALLDLSLPGHFPAFYPPAFGEIGVKSRIRAVLRYRRPAAWIIAVSVLFCTAFIFCFMTDPMTEGKETETMTAGRETETIATPVTAGREPETASAAESQSGKSPSETAPGSSKTATEEQEYRKKEAVPEHSSFKFTGTPIRWFDFSDSYPTLPESGITAELDCFPGVTFRYSGDGVEAIEEESSTVLYTAMPVWNIYFADLNMDDIPELCSCASIGSGIISDQIIAVDYKNQAAGLLSDRMKYDYRLSMPEGVPQLIAEKWDYASQKLLRRGLLILDMQEASSSAPDPSYSFFLPLEHTLKAGQKHGLPHGADLNFYPIDPDPVLDPVKGVYIWKDKKSQYPLLTDSSFTLYEKGLFVFTLNPLSSYMGFGSWTQEGDRLILTTDDGLYEYIFTAEGDGYVYDASAPKGYTNWIPDGAVFTLTTVPEGQQ